MGARARKGLRVRCTRVRAPLQRLAGELGLHPRVQPEAHISLGTFATALTSAPSALLVRPFLLAAPGW